MGLLMDGDKIAARMAFKESYERAVSVARAERKPVCWRMSLGHDVAGREAAITEATIKGLISTNYAVSLLPYEAHEQFFKNSE